MIKIIPLTFIVLVLSVSLAQAHDFDDHQAPLRQHLIQQFEGRRGEIRENVKNRLLEQHRKGLLNAIAKLDSHFASMEEKINATQKLNPEQKQKLYKYVKERRNTIKQFRQQVEKATEPQQIRAAAQMLRQGIDNTREQIQAVAQKHPRFQQKPLYQNSWRQPKHGPTPPVYSTFKTFQNGFGLIWRR